MNGTNSVRDVDSNSYELLNSLLLTPTENILKSTQAILSSNSSTKNLVPELTDNNLSQLEQKADLIDLKQNAFKSPPNAALIVIDMQWDFIRGTLRTDECPARQDGLSIVPNVNRLLQMPFKQICVSYDWHPADHCSFYQNRGKLQLGPNSPISNVQNAQLFDTVTLIDSRGVEREQKLWPMHCVANTEGSKLHPDLNLPESHIVIKKGTMPTVESYSVFGDPYGLEDTGLSSKLQKSGIKTLILCGIAFEVCVASTALDAIKQGYQIILVEDACVGLSHDSIREKRLAMLQAGVHITKTEKIPEFLSGRFLPVQHVLNAIRSSNVSQSEKNTK